MELKIILKELEEKLRNQRHLLNITRIVKLLYLIEIEYFQDKQKRLTNLTWKFHHYGPMPMEIYDYCNENNIDINNLELEDGKTIKTLDFSSIKGSITGSEENYLKSLITHVVDDFGKLSMKDLLDHVYFETDPMKEAKRGDVLDFTKIKREEVYIPKKMNLTNNEKKKLKEIKKRLNNLLKDKIDYKSYSHKFNNKNTENSDIISIPLKGEVVIDS